MAMRSRMPPTLSTARAPERGQIQLTADDLAAVAGLRRMQRLRADLGVNLVGAAIIVDLVERLERMAGSPKERE